MDVPALTSVMSFYSKDLEEFNLCTQLELLPSLITDTRNVDVTTIRTCMKQLPHGQRTHFAQIVKLLRLFLLAPPTNVVSEVGVLHVLMAFVKSVSLFFRLFVRSFVRSWSL